MVFGWLNVPGGCGSIIQAFRRLRQASVANYDDLGTEL